MPSLTKIENFAKKILVSYVTWETLPLKRVEAFTKKQRQRTKLMNTHFDAKNDCNQTLNKTKKEVVSWLYNARSSG